MFGPPGHAYVYFTYGNHFCMNVVTGEEGVASAVLLRALEPIHGIDMMMRRRGVRKPEHVASGPGKLTQALRIGRNDDGVSLLGPRMWIEEPSHESTFKIIQTPRIGISRAVENPFRYIIEGSRFVSRIRIC
jgi:DNA-3-methyladenine glycosylase